MKLLIYILIASLFSISCRKIQDVNYAQPSSSKISVTKEFKEGEIMIRYKSGGGDQKSSKQFHNKTMERFGYKPIRILKVDNVDSAVSVLKQHPNVDAVSPNYKRSTTYIPNDPYFSDGRLWGINKIGAPTAWASDNVGNKNVYVAVADEGAMYWHPDLCNAIWNNPYDTVDGIDNDGNGFVDDFRGWNAMNDNNIIYGGTSFNHGTHVDGTIAGTGDNGQGVVGVAPKTQIIHGKFLEYFGYDIDAIELIDYFTDLKLRHNLNIVAISCSWGGGGYNQFLKESIDRAGAANILVICAAGNSSADIDAGAFYPAAYDCENIISVGAMSYNNDPAGFSNYGATGVDLFAPGVGIYSTVYDGNLQPSYAAYNGTSMATPHVSGAAALYKSVNPSATAQQIKAALMNSVTASPLLQGKCITGGYLNVSTFLGNSGGVIQPDNNVCTEPYLDRVPPTPPVISVSGVDSTSIELSWSPSIDSSAIKNYWIYVWKRADGQTENFAWVLGGNSTSFNIPYLHPGVEYGFHMRSADVWGNFSDQSNIVYATPSGTFDPEPPTTPTNFIAYDSTANTISVKWNASTDNIGLREYEVSWSKVGSGSYFGQATTQTSYTINNLQPGTVYDLRVRAIDVSNNSSGYGTDVCSTLTSNPPPPPPPVSISANLSGTVSGAIHNLSWTITESSPNAISSVLQVRSNGGSPFEDLADVSNQTSYSYNPNTNKRLTYRLKVSDGTLTVYSNEIILQSKKR